MTITADQDAEQPTRTPGKELRRAARKTAFRHRHSLIMLAPIVWLSGLQFAGWLFEITAMSLLLRLGLVIVGVAAAVIAIARRGVAPFGVGITLSFLWLLAAYIWGPYGGTALVLWSVGLVMAVPFWRRHRARYRRGPVANEPQPELPATPAVDQTPVQLWAERAAPNNPHLAGTHLATPEALPGIGFTAEIVGVPGKTQTDNLIKATGTIASAWEVSLPQVIVEPTRTGNNSRGRLTVIERADQLQQTRFLEEDQARIDPDTGIARVGYFGDGQPAHWAFYTKKRGAQMGCNCGTTGSGKSEFGSTKMALARGCETIATILLDAQGGNSQPDWNDRTNLTALGVEKVFSTTLALDYVMGRRSEFLASVSWVDEHGRERRGKKFLFPGDPDVGGRPGVPYSGMKMLLLVFEELPLLLKSPTYGKQAIDILGPAAKTWRKPGGAIDIYAQNIGLAELKEDVFRANIFGGGSIAAFRTGSSVDHHMAGLAADPSKLPEYFPDGQETVGLGYLKGVDRRPAASWRSMIAKDTYGIATSPAACQIDDITLGFFDEYFHHLARGRQPVPPAKTGEREQTGGDVEAVVESVLERATRFLDVADIVAAAGGQLGDASLSEIKAALARLATRLPVVRDGDTWALLSPEGTLRPGQ
ncbi:hypothetical protein ACIBG7_12910 [Nonomuraea sp. NPDC050328]|uniref:hypothetical protein n=1 Tax=Nonomuraea sp. NPDC050328 TaxID=3364361 RepID=UPI00379D178B